MAAGGGREVGDLGLSEVAADGGRVAEAVEGKRVDS